MIVNESTIRDVITIMQKSAVIASSLTPFQRADEEIMDSLQDMTIDESNTETIDVAQHFHVVDAFTMPRLSYDEHTRTFHRYSNFFLRKNVVPELIFFF